MLLATGRLYKTLIRVINLFLNNFIFIFIYLFINSRKTATDTNRCLLRFFLNVEFSLE